MLVESPWFSAAPYPEVSLWTAIEEASRKFGSKAAFVTANEGTTYTFSQIAEAATGFSSYLTQQGYGRGDRLAIIAPNSPEYVVAVFGALRAGLTVTTFNPLYKEREIEHQLLDSEAKIVVCHSMVRPVVDVATPNAPLVRATHNAEEVWDLAKSVASIAPPVEVDPRTDLAFLPYSSGTTGLPKGVMLSHYNIVANCRQFLGLGITNNYTVLLDFLPFFHIYGLTVLMISGYLAGSKQVVMMRFDLEQTLALIERYRVTSLFVVPPALLALANTPLREKYDTSSLQILFSGAAPLGGEIEARVESLYSVKVLQGYGMTETSPVLNSTPILFQKPGYVGPPIPDTIEKVVDPVTGRECGVDEVGELWARGPQIMLGYWKRPDATADMITEDGWLKTGDIVVMDENGYVKIVDRAREMIKYKGYQIAPAELEALLQHHPDLVDAAVVPKPDEEAGEVPKAYVVKRPGHDPAPAEILRYIDEQVAPYKKIRELEFVDAIPRNPSGKILRRQLIQQERERAGGA